METRVTVTLVVYDEAADPDHETGLTEEAYVELMAALSNIGNVEDVARLD